MQNGQEGVRERSWQLAVFSGQEAVSGGTSSFRVLTFPAEAATGER